MQRVIHENTFTVYMHITPSGRKYVGITSKEPEVRWNNGLGYKHRNPHFWRAIQKHSWDNIEHIIIADNLSQEWACRLEQILIRDYQLQNPKYGYNKAGGGEYGACGVKRSEETRRKMSLALTGRAPTRKGAHPTEEQIQKFIEARRKSDNFGLGKHLSEEHKQKIGDALRGKKLNLTDDQRSQMSERKTGKNNPNYGKIWIYNEEKSIQIYPQDLPKYLELGYTKGRKFFRR